jgi:hypothetical protein
LREVEQCGEDHGAPFGLKLYSMFRITKIEKSDHFEDRYTIWLDNVPAIKRSYRQMLKFIAREMYCSARKRFQK